MCSRFFLLFLSCLFVSFPALAAQAEPQPALKGPTEKKKDAKKTDPAKARPAGAGEAHESPAVLSADTVTAKENQVFEAIGNVELRKDDQTVSADHLLYEQPTQELSADGSVKVQKADSVVEGPSLQLNVEKSTGEMPQPVFSLTDSAIRGSAENMRFEGKQQYAFESGVYTSCPAGNDDWLLKMSTLELDRNTQLGTAWNARLEFMGVPFLYSPWMNFPLDDRRRSGFMGPTIGNTNTGGSEITIPFYWNIASNYDATFSPRLIEKRGTLLDSEFRYLGNSYSGTLTHGDLPGDRVAQRDRETTSLMHNQNFGGGFTGYLNLNEASDDAYFRDLSSNPTIATQKNLLREGGLVYSGGWWNASVRAQSFQTLQDPLAPVTEPYRRLPQVNLNAQRVLGSASLGLSSEYVYFDHPTLVNGGRSVVYPTVAMPLVSDPAYYITPKFGEHLTQYDLTNNNTNAESHYQRAVPIFSLDSGMTLERNFAAFDRSLIQTLEPRIYYVKIPYVKQDNLPLFDTGQAPFSFMQMFTENRFIGNDRVGDADQVTTALTTRLLDEDTGNELLRIAMGERFSAITPQVTIGGPSVATNQSDVLLSVGGRLSDSLSLDSLEQYNPTEQRSEMFYGTLRYKPEPGKVFNLGYRYTYNIDPTLLVKQVDTSTQWHLYGKWDMVGLVKYSIQNASVTEALAGLEYRQDCWALRLVAQKFVTSLSQTSTNYFIQLELSDMIRVGTDPLNALKQSVPGYTVMTNSTRGKYGTSTNP